ncbi:hypothetical protein PR202_gb08102 [Eleusine coracana subsp. coracana]|uniref:Uncharacterized protein n=1 Tax=Eleusine coracana subsp. coracana TaxID=191504 RepID=A0AAV5EDU1_ELECO|nr:hypothetical protein PR202_gb08102 [Eleusine coracana subsp. coracana]
MSDAEGKVEGRACDIHLFAVNSTLACHRRRSSLAGAKEDADDASLADRDGRSSSGGSKIQGSSGSAYPPPSAAGAASREGRATGGAGSGTAMLGSERGVDGVRDSSGFERGR